MAFTQSLNFGSVFLCKKVCSHVASRNSSLIRVNFGVYNSSARKYSKLVPRNGLFKVINPKFNQSHLKLVSSSVHPVSNSSVFPQSIIRMLTSTSAKDSASNPKSSPDPLKSDKESSQKVENENENETEASSPASPPTAPALSTKEKLKQAVRDYGATVIVFHVTMSLMSLGFFYLLVQSGLDVVSILSKLGISESFTQSKITEEAGKFVVAYAVHKVFAPLRITITLTATPFIVRKLRAMGILKQMTKKTK